MPPFIHPTAEVSNQATVGEGTRIWSHAQVREGAVIGAECNIGKNVYIDFGVSIGSMVKIQNNASVYHGVTVEDGVFIGPHVCFCNDMLPRAITPDGRMKGNDDWEVGPTLVRYGASVGAGSVILPNVTIGSFALIGAGSVVTRSVPDHGLVYGNPARLHGYVCACGRLLEGVEAPPENGEFPRCSVCLEARDVEGVEVMRATEAPGAIDS
jgi:UDP-2-acetamido-3-amino-2,3-dideoxy-glucuronate N-acetyltransferase